MGLADIGRTAVALVEALGAHFVALFYSLHSLALCFVPRSYRRYDVTGKIVLITGGGSGIGRLMAVKLARRGAKIVLWDINMAGNEETASLVRKEGGQCFCYSVNVCDRNVIYSVAKRVKKEVGKVDILVNNAGIVSGNKILDCTDEQIIRTYEVNILSHFWTVKAFLPDMMSSKSGHIVTVASLAGFCGAGKLVDYCSSKFAAVGFDESLRLELMGDGHTGISTTVVCPFYINTGMFDGVTSKLFPVLDQDYVAEEATDAILMKTPILILPPTFKILLVIKSFVTVSGFQLIYKACGGVETMANFQGRKKLN